MSYFMRPRPEAGSAKERRRWDSNPRRLFTLHDFQSCSLGHYETPPVRRREWDSNPRGLFTLPLFESGTFDHSDISPRRSIAYPVLYDKYDDRKGRHYYTPAWRAEAYVYSSDDPCGRHGEECFIR